MKFNQTGSTLLGSIMNWVKLNLFFFIGVYSFEIFLKWVFVAWCFPFADFFELSIQTLVFGLGIDLSVSAAITLLFSLLLFVHQWIKIDKVLIIVFSFIVILHLWVLIADINFFHFWRWRLQAQAFDYLKDFSIVLKTLPPEIGLYVFVLLVVSYWIMVKFYQKWKSQWKFKVDQLPQLPLKNPFRWVMWVILFIVIRGGVGPAVNSWGDVMKSSKTEISVASMNGIWNFGYVLMSSEKGTQMKQLLVSEQLEQFACKQYGGEILSPRELRKYWFRDQNLTPKYCFVIMLEGINAQWFEKNRLPLQMTTQWQQSMVYFDHCYAVGDRTDKGLAAIMTGWPGEPGKGILHEPTRWQYLTGLPQMLKKQGWNSNFIYGGDGSFSNMNGFMKQMGVESIYDESLIKTNKKPLKWGISDLAVQQWLTDAYLRDLQFIQTTDNRNQFTLWMQLASHEPFDVANPKKNMLERYKQSIQHSDSAVSNFLFSLKRLGIWDESLVVVLSDHGRDLGLEPTQDAAEFFRIPLFIGGGIIDSQSIQRMSSQICSQTDIYATLSFLLNTETDNESYQSDFFSYPWLRLISPGNKVEYVISFNGERSILLGKNQFSEGLMGSKNIQKSRVDSIRIGIQSKIIRTFFRF